MTHIIQQDPSFLLPRSLNMNEDYDFALYPEHPQPELFSPDLYTTVAMQNYLDGSNSYSFPRPHHEQYPSHADFNGEQFGHITQFQDLKQSPHGYPVSSPELRAPPSTLSTASGPSAASSIMGSPYSSHAHPAPPMVQGLGACSNNPGIVGYDNYGSQEYAFPSGMDTEYTFAELKPGFVGECGNISTVSLSSSSAFSNFMQPQLSLDDQLSNQKGDAVAPLMSSSVSVEIPRKDFCFKSPGTPASASPLSARRFSAFSFGNNSRGSSNITEIPSSPPSPFVQASQTNATGRSPRPANFFSHTSGQFVAPLESSYPSLIHGYPVAPVQHIVDNSFQQHAFSYPPPSPALSQHSSHSPGPVRNGNHSPYYNSYPYPDRRPSMVSRHSHSSLDSSFASDAPEKGRCPQPDCGKVFKDLKAHMLTHQTERPEKCPITTCDYHVKGFARKYDKNRHTLTHYKGTMVCGFCPGGGSAAEKSFNRADVFKRHLTSVHAVEQTPPNSRKKMAGSSSNKKGLAGYAPDATGKCSTCSATFSNAQDFYEHLDDCVLRIVQQEDPSEAINAKRLAEVENDANVHETLLSNNLPTATIKIQFPDIEVDDDEMDDAGDEDYQGGSKRKRSSPNGKRQGLTHSKGGVTLHTKAVRKNRKNNPTSWGCNASQMKMKKRVMCAFDGPRRLFKDDMMLSTEHEVRIPLADGRSYVTDLDIQTMRRVEGFHGATDEEKGPDFWAGPSDDHLDLHELMKVKQEDF